MSKAYHYDWKTLIEEQQKSGMNMKKYCREHDLPYHTFKYHKYGLLSDVTKEQTFIPVVKDEKPQEIQFILNGNTIRFDSSLDDETISRIIKALSS